MGFFCVRCSSANKTSPDMVCPDCGYIHNKVVRVDKSKLTNGVRTQKLADLLDMEEIAAELTSGDVMRNNLAAIARKYNVSMGGLHKFLNSPDNKAKYEECKRAKAYWHAEKAYEELEGTSDSNPDVKLRTERSYYHRWMAEMFNRPQFGKAVHVEVNDVTLSPEERAKKLAALQAKAQGLENDEQSDE